MEFERLRIIKMNQNIRITNSDRANMKTQELENI